MHCLSHTISFLSLTILASTVFSAEPMLTLQQKLNKEDLTGLVKDVRSLGNASRGALVFFRQDMACIRCHASGDSTNKYGPELAKSYPETNDAYLVESMLLPSKVIKKGFETLIITTKAGKTLTGLIAEEKTDFISIRDGSLDGKLITILKKDIEEKNNKGASMMPDGLINVLSGRQEFLDLARFVIEMAEKGPEYAKQMRPASSFFATLPVPEYEKEIDHAGMLNTLDAKSFKRGEAIYVRVCANCHGTKEMVGSLPTSLRFAEGKFKNGADPFKMYQTLTHGYAIMTPQTWMVPEQKYDVIHYIREAFLKPFNPSQYSAMDLAYLETLPKGSTRGPKPSNIEPWVVMNYGPTMMATIEVGDKGNFAYKGIAVRLDSGAGGITRGKQWTLFDHDTMRMAAAWDGESFIDYNGINFNGRHGIHPRVSGNVRFSNPVGPGWANPETGSFEDPRFKGRDGKLYGPLPKTWAKYLGMYHYGNQAIIAYTVGDTNVLEMPAYEITPEGKVVYIRNLNVGKSSRDLILRVAPVGTSCSVVGSQASLMIQDGFQLLKIPASESSKLIKVLQSDCELNQLQAFAKTATAAFSLEPFISGGPKRWPDVLKTQPILGQDKKAFEIDVLTHPTSNPWNCQMRLTGLDFYADGKSAAVCTWDGDVWLVEGLASLEKGLTWKRIASGLFQPLGLKIINNIVHLTCRDQLVILRDLNGDGETDFYECFNNDHQVTDHFHEFAMGLQVDAEGNFYYAKSARHALKALVPHHGTLLKVSKDGSNTEILATGFRAANGVCLNPDGSFFLTDQEGFWMPKNRINRVEKGSYHGNFWGYHDITDSSDSAMKNPVCWITNEFDRSPSELLWVTSDVWGPLKGSLLNFSYGYGKVYVVPHELIGGEWQGGMCALPIPQFPTGVSRGRFHPQDGQLYCCGMFAWAGNQTAPGGFYRIRYTGKPVELPVTLHARKGGMNIGFSGLIEEKSATSISNYSVKTWALKRSEKYGSKHLDEKFLKVTAARLSANGKSITLDIDGMEPTWCMEIKYTVKSADGADVQGVIHNSIHRLGD